MAYTDRATSDLGQPAFVYDDRHSASVGRYDSPLLATVSYRSLARVEVSMSAINGDKARFQKDRKRKVIHRQRIEALRRKQRESKPHPTGSGRPAGEPHTTEKVTL